MLMTRKGVVVWKKWRADSQNHVVKSQSVSTNDFVKKPVGQATEPMPCIFFNQDSCSYYKTHRSQGIVYRNMFPSCFTNADKSFGYSESQY